MKNANLKTQNPNATKPATSKPSIIEALITLVAIPFFVFVPKMLIAAGLPTALAIFLCVFAYAITMEIYQILTALKNANLVPAKLVAVTIVAATVFSLAITGIVSIFVH